MRVLLWHGWLLEGSGSNVYTAKVAETLRRAGHDVLLLCQEPHPERLGFVDAFGRVDSGAVSALVPTGAGAAPGRCILVRPDIGSLLPVFVVDEYEGFTVKPFTELTDGELAGYLVRNAAALRAAAEWHRPDVVIAGHAIPGAVVASRALGPGRYLAKVHGSDLEYAARVQPRLADLTREGLESASVVVGATADVVRRAVQFAPSAADRMVVIPPGVEVERFRPRPRREALLDVAELLGQDPDVARGWSQELDRALEEAIRGRDAGAIAALAHEYDQTVPDTTTKRLFQDLGSDLDEHGPPYVAGFFGKLIPQKGVDLFLSALHVVRAETIGLVVGFGSFRPWLDALRGSLLNGDAGATRWLADHAPMTMELTHEDLVARRRANLVHFTGRLDHRYAPFALASMDVLVVPSIMDEAFGMVAAEGAASGALPLVARHSGLAEVAAALESEIGRPGLFSYEPGPDSVHRIAAGLETLLALPEAARAELRAGVAAFVAREWTWDRTTGRLLEAARS